MSVLKQVSGDTQTFKEEQYEEWKQANIFSSTKKFDLCILPTSKSHTFSSHNITRVAINMPAHITSITDGEARSDSLLSHPVPSSTSHFLDTKIAALQHETVQIAHIKEDLGASLDCAKISPEQYNQEIYPILKRFRKTSQMLQVLARQRSLIEEGFEEAVERMRQRTLGPLDDNIFETVYEDTIVPCVIRAAAKVGKSRSDTRSFKKAVHQWYNVTKESLALVFGMEGLTEPYSICHVIGAGVDYPSSKPAYLVPKSLSPNEVSHIFGIAEDVISSDPQNGMEHPLLSERMS